MGIVVDASVAIKWFVNEVGSDAARRLWQAVPELVAPDLLVPEVCNVAWKKVRRGEMVSNQASDLAVRLTHSAVTFHPSEGLASRAMAIALATDHPVYDCFYIALAEAEGSSLVTADARLVTRFAASPWAPLVTKL